MSIKFPALKSSFTLFETFSFSVSGIITWFLTFPIAHAALGISALYIWIPGAIISMFTNLQVKQIAPKYMDVVGGTPIYTAIMLKDMPHLARYGAMGHTWGWMMLALINSYLFNDTIQQEFIKYGIIVPTPLIMSGFFIFCYLISLASQRLPSVLHMFLVYPLIAMLCYIFVTMGIYGLQHPSILYQQQWQTVGFLAFVQWYFFLMYTIYNGDIVTSFIPESRDKQNSINILTVVAIFTPVVFVLGSWSFALFAPATFDGNLTTFISTSLRPVFGNQANPIAIILIIFTSIISSITGVGVAARTLYGMSNIGIMSKHLGFLSRRNTLDNAILTIAVSTASFGFIVKDLNTMIVVTGLSCSMLYSILRFAYWRTKDNTLPFRRVSLFVGILEFATIIVGAWLLNPYYLFFGLLLPLSHPFINFVSYILFHVGRSMKGVFHWFQKIRPEYEVYNLMVMIGIVAIGSLLAYGLSTFQVEDQPIIQVIVQHPSLFIIFMIIFLMLVIMLSGWTTIPQVVEYSKY
jgi:hypothetical protein